VCTIDSHFDSFYTNAHTNRTDCWIAIKGLVYDVTPYLQEHPGGVPAIVMNAGMDASEDFSVSFYFSGLCLT
jgi:cytochrome b involved in lipid metabolism